MAESVIGLFFLFFGLVKIGFLKKRDGGETEERKEGIKGFEEMGFREDVEDVVGGLS